MDYLKMKFANNYCNISFKISTKIGNKPDPEKGPEFVAGGQMGFLSNSCFYNILPREGIHILFLQ
jgi:hypothetical protein